MAKHESEVTFSGTIKKYFTQLDHDMMMDPTHTGGFTIDLWDSVQVKQKFSLISRVIKSGQMPPKPSATPPDSDGPWSNEKINQFISDFNAWKAGGFSP